MASDRIKLGTAPDPPPPCGGGSGVLSRTATRKAMQSVGSIVPAVLLTLFAISPPKDVHEALALLTACFAALGGCPLRALPLPPLFIKHHDNNSDDDYPPQQHGRIWSCCRVDVP